MGLAYLDSKLLVCLKSWELRMVFLLKHHNQTHWHHFQPRPCHNQPKNPGSKINILDYIVKIHNILRNTQLSLKMQLKMIDEQLMENNSIVL